MVLVLSGPNNLYVLATGHAPELQLLERCIRSNESNGGSVESPSEWLQRGFPRQCQTRADFRRHASQKMA